MPTQSRSGTGRATKKKRPAAGLQSSAERNSPTTAPEAEESGADSRPQVTAANLERREIPSFSISREARIAEAAYWRAERRGFTQGQELDDWLAAEREIDEDLAKNRQP